MFGPVATSRLVLVADSHDVAYYERWASFSPQPPLAVRFVLPILEARSYMTDKRLVLTTAASNDEAHKIARALLEGRLAACVNIVSKIESIYRWQGKVEESEEFLLIIKTTEAALKRLQEAIRELHSYELPECIVLPVVDGSQPYLNWIAASVE
jgi:periplasmic divalent cation tolerance protein